MALEKIEVYDEEDFDFLPKRSHGKVGSGKRKIRKKYLERKGKKPVLESYVGLEKDLDLSD